MIIVRLELILEFQENTKIRTPARSVFEILGGQVSDVQKPREPNAIIRREKEKFAVRWDYDSCKILHEDVYNYGECIKDIITLLEKINKVAPIGSLSCKKLITFWILPTDKYDFKSLELKYRQAFIKENELFTDCIDSSVVVDMKRDGLVLSHQSGAMELSQLQNDFREFKIKGDFPKIFLFLSSTIVSKITSKYLTTDMEEFITGSLEMCKSHSDNFEKMMRGVL